MLKTNLGITHYIVQYKNVYVLWTEHEVMYVLVGMITKSNYGMS